MRESKSGRRFSIGPSHVPVIQSIAATSPLAVLFIWFLYQAYIRPSENCAGYSDSYEDDNRNEQVAEECSYLIALGDMVIVCVVIALYWAILACYLTFYVPRRHRLVELYLSEGKTVIGDVYYSNRSTKRCCFLTSYGTVVYSHPTMETPVMIQRQVLVYEKYTRERAGLLYLPDQPCSAQPKEDLQIDYDVAQRNKDRLDFMKMFSVGWLLFSLVCPLYILSVLYDMNNDDDDGDDNNDNNQFWLPDYGRYYAFYVYFVFVLLVIPLGSIFVNVIAWKMHENWVTSKHNVLLEGDPIVPPGCCFDDDDDDDDDAEVEIQSHYKPSSKSKFQQVNDR
jgi:hypothetical protein